MNLHNKRSKWLITLFPFLRWSKRINANTFRDDLLAGLIGAIVVLPQGVAFAAIAGMPPEYGLYAGMVPAIIAALFGSSWHLVSGPTTAASIVLFSALSEMAQPGSVDYIRLALTLTFMVGIIQLVMGLVRLGTLVNFISHSVVIGFTAGAAILIITNQIKHFFGLDMPSGQHFFESIVTLITEIENVNGYVASIALVTLVAGILSRKFIPKIPYLIVAMVTGSVLALILNKLIGQSTTEITTMGSLPASLPPLSAPDFSLQTIVDLAPIAFAATLFALTEAVSIARAIAAKTGQTIDGNQEFIGQGLSNIAGSFFSAYVATGSFNRSGLNYEAGAKTPIAAISAALFLILLVLFLAPLASYLPNATMAAILFLVAWGIIDFHHIGKVVKSSRSESVVLFATFFSTLFLELDFAIFLGVMLSLILYLNRTSKPKILTRVPDPRLPRRAFNTDPALPECPQLKIIRIDGSLFFGAVSHVQENLRRVEQETLQQKNLLIVANGINFVDISGAELLAAEAIRRNANGGKLFFSLTKEEVYQQLKKADHVRDIGEGNFFRTKTDAISTIYYKHMDPSICANCKHRIFNECSLTSDIKVSL